MIGKQMMKLQQLQQKKETRRREEILRKKGQRKRHNLIEIEDSEMFWDLGEEKITFTG